MTPHPQDTLSLMVASAHTSSGEGHTTREVDAVVLGPRGEGEHRGVGTLGVRGGEGDLSPGEGGWRPPLTGPSHHTGEVGGAAGY